jgi:hypothetical protein
MICPNCRRSVRLKDNTGYNKVPEFDTQEYTGDWNSIYPVFTVAGVQTLPIEIRVHESKEYPWHIRVRRFFKCPSCAFEFDSFETDFK